MASFICISEVYGDGDVKKLFVCIYIHTHNTIIYKKHNAKSFFRCQPII